MSPSATTTCSSCGSLLVAGEQFCGACGTPAAGTPVRACGSCRREVLPTERFCPACGTPVPGAASTWTSGPGTGAAPVDAWGAVLRRLRAATLGDFEIKRELGRGGMAAVYLAHEIALNRKVALKVMSPGIMTGEGMVDRFRQEAVTVANLSHPHIVRVHAVRQVDELHFIVMQYVPGRALERVLRETGPLPFPIARAILGQVAAALGYAHRRGVVHRDIKPGNILLDAGGDAVVTDFGIAKVQESPSNTITGSVVGTPPYMSPEQCFAYPLTGASDQYALGIVAYEMLTGTVPFTGAAYAVMQGHTDRPVPSLRERRPDVPGDLEAAVMRMLEKRAEDRFASMAEAAAALGTMAVGEHDPLRDELARLAAADETAALDALVPTPKSPIPQTKRTTPRPAPAPEPPKLPPPAGRTLVEPAPTPAPTPATTPATTPAPVPLAGVPPASAPPASAPPAATGTSATTGTRARDQMPPLATPDAAAVRRARRSMLVAALALAAIAGAVWVATRDDDAPVVVTPEPETPDPKAPEPPGPAATLRVADVPMVIAVGDTFRLSAIFSGPDSLAARPNRWRSRASGVVAIDAASGLARAVREGSATVAVERGALADSTVLHVLPAVAEGEVRRALAIRRPTSATLRIGERLRLRADLSVGGERQADLPDVAWRSSDPSVAAVDRRTGEVVARSAGRASVTVESPEPGIVPSRIALVVEAPPPPAPQPQPEPKLPEPKNELPPPPLPKSDPPPPRGPTAAELRRDVELGVRGLAQAIESGDIGRLRGAYPGMSGDQERAYRDFFSIARDIRITVGRIEVPETIPAATGSRVSVPVEYAIQYRNTATRRTDHDQTRWVVTLERAAAGWRIVSVR